MREASIHIKKSTFKDICSFLEIDMDVDSFFHIASKYALNSRLVVTKDVKTRISKSTTINADKFNFLLHSARINLRHKCAIILKTDSAYNTLTDITTLAEQFCTLFNYNIDEGFTEYIRIGLSLLKKNYNIGKFKYYNQKIIELKQIELDVHSDTSKKDTDDLIKYYEELSGFILNSNHRIHFIRVAAMCNENSINAKNFIKTQFNYYKALNLLPEPYQLYTQASLDRFKVTKKDNMIDKILKRKNGIHS